MRAPFGSRFAWLYALAAPAFAFIAVYRAALYGFPRGVWVLSLSLALLGLATPFVLGGRFRNRLFTGKLPLALALPFLGIVVSPRLLVPSPLTVGPFLFCAGALAGTCAIAWLNVWHRRRRLQRLLDDGDPERSRTAESFVEAYFAAVSAAERETDWRALRAALRAQAWLSTPSRRARAAAGLREAALASQMRRQVPIPAELPVLRYLAEACAGTPERARSAYVSAAAKLETGGRIFRWRAWLWSLIAPGLDAERDWIAAIDFLARRHAIACPSGFRAYCRALAHAPLTERDVAPLQSFRPVLARPLAAGIAVLVFASVLLSTATAQPPLDDARRLPVMTGARAQSHVEPRLSDVLSSLAGHRAEARCWSPVDWRRLSRQRTTWPHHDRRLGRWSAYASPPHSQAHFSTALCAALSRLAYERIPVRRDEWPAALAFSVATLAHEAQHLRGILNEAKAECYGMQAIARTAELLGRSRDEGRYLAALYWRFAYNDERRDRNYFSDECRNGGRLDLRPVTDLWP